MQGGSHVSLTFLEFGIVSNFSQFLLLEYKLIHVFHLITLYDSFID